MKECRIVCAALKHKSGVIILGPRHFDATMRKQLKLILGPDTEVKHSDFVQGFIDNKGTFLTRMTAWAVASAANQVIAKVGGDGANAGTLYSENLY